MSEGQQANWERLGEVVSKGMKTWSIPGVAVGVLHGGEAATAGFGVTSVDHPLPITPGTLFQIGSITKTFVGTAMLRLVEAGKVDLDATVRTYVPDFQVADEEAAARATVRHLLTHTGGWAGDFFHQTGSGDEALARYVADMADLPQLAPLGTVWSYNNAGFSLAGHVIERVTGKAFEAALTELVLEPLGMTQSFLDPGEVMTHRFVVGHHEAEGDVQVARPWPLVRSSVPAGGIVCSVEELLRYARFHLGDGRAEGGDRLLAAESVAQMQAPQVTVWGSEAWGLTWAVREVDGVRQVSHGGGTNGQITLLVLVPERDFALAVLTNADRGGFLTERLRRWALKAYLDLEVSVPTAIDSTEEELAEFTGRYEGYFQDLELGILGGRLVGQVIYKRSFPSEEVPPPPPPPPAAVARCEVDRLLVLDGPAKDSLGDIVRDDEGAVAWIRFGGRLHRRLS